jgi:hypothetical protein
MPAHMLRMFSEADTGDLPDRPKAKRGNPERDIQMAIVAFVRRCCPGCIVQASVNEAAATTGLAVVTD